MLFYLPELASKNCCSPHNTASKTPINAERKVKLVVSVTSPAKNKCNITTNILTDTSRCSRSNFIFNPLAALYATTIYKLTTEKNPQIPDRTELVMISL